MNVVDTTSPIITLIGEDPITIEVGSTFTDPGATATDNYDDNVTVTSDGSVDTDTLGSYTITYTATDSSGNTSTTTRVVNVVDTTSPTITCFDSVDVSLDENGIVELIIDDILESSFDLSGIASTILSINSFDCSNLGQNNVTVTVTDNYGNVSECNSVVNVLDQTPPEAICLNINLTLENGIANITSDDIDGGSTDQCSIQSVELSQYDFTEDDLGENIVIMTINDNSGNSSYCEALVTVEAGLSLIDNLIQNLVIYPNPTSDFIYLNTDFLMDFTVYSSIGQKISEGKTDRKINISELQSGVYYFRFKKDNQTTIRKVIKN